MERSSFAQIERRFPFPSIARALTASQYISSSSVISSFHPEEVECDAASYVWLYLESGLAPGAGHASLQADMESADIVGGLYGSRGEGLKLWRREGGDARCRGNEPAFVWLLKCLPDSGLRIEDLQGVQLWLDAGELRLVGQASGEGTGYRGELWADPDGGGIVRRLDMRDWDYHRWDRWRRIDAGGHHGSGVQSRRFPDGGSVCVGHASHVPGVLQEASGDGAKKENGDADDDYVLSFHPQAVLSWMPPGPGLGLGP